MKVEHFVKVFKII